MDGRKNGDSNLFSIVLPGAAHLWRIGRKRLTVTQRGNRREGVFFTEWDRHVYLSYLPEYARKQALHILAYCLMANHVHLVAVPRHTESLAGALKPVHLRYAQHVNGSQGLSGRLWQGRFYSCPMDDAHLYAAVRHVERNPVRAGIVTAAETYPWSSAAVHCGQRGEPFLADRFGMGEVIENWAAWLREAPRHCRAAAWTATGMSRVQAGGMKAARSRRG
jgi:putative transposase